ncbi:energy transducer TonB [Adhaeribacter terreus]|uniref:Energy transducer TonB n=2 Tax=Adhaeribacter terreus TaxID=529703 RepID=A0ABW0E5C1_9BACT
MMKAYIFVLLLFFTSEIVVAQKKEINNSKSKISVKSKTKKDVVTEGQIHVISCPGVIPLDYKPNHLDSGNETVYSSVDTMPDYKWGGTSGLLKFIQENLNYPKTRLSQEGLVITQFIVDENGKVLEPVILRGLCSQADQEALRIVRLLEFNPGIQDGKKVKVRYTLPVKFKYK